MKCYRKILKAILFGLLFPVLFNFQAYAATTGVSQVEGFIKNIITAVASIAGIIATAYFVVGGLRYITSSGNPQHLEKAKRTILYSATGLVITIAAFVLSGIVTNLANSSFGG